MFGLFVMILFLAPEGQFEVISAYAFWLGHQEIHCILRHTCLNFIRLRQDSVFAFMYSVILLLWNLEYVWEFCLFITSLLSTVIPCCTDICIAYFGLNTHDNFCLSFTFTDRWSVNCVLERHPVWNKTAFSTWHFCVGEGWRVYVSSMLTTVDVILAVRLSKLYVFMLMGVKLNKNE
jgi:hypothetical protein